MEWNSHHSISHIECFLNSIPMMHIDVYIKHTTMSLKQFQDPEHYVIHIAETWGFSLFSMMKSPCPVYADIALFIV